MRRAVVLLLLASSAAACRTASDARPADAPVPPSVGATITPSPTALPTTVAPDPDAVLPDGFERVRATVTEPDGVVCELCVWLADTSDRRRRGLMSVTDLGGADGMAFLYPSPHSGTFWMKNTLLPLSIAFFDPAGAYLDAFDMEPCTSEPCRQYPTPDDFVVAIETTQGALPGIGIVPGSVLDLTDLPCA